MPRTFLIRSSSAIGQHLEECPQEPCSSSSDVTQNRDQSETFEVQCDKDPIDLSTTRSKYSSSSSNLKPPLEIQGTKPCLPRHEEQNYDLSSSRSTQRLQDKFALPMDNYKADRCIAKRNDNGRFHITTVDDCGRKSDTDNGRWANERNRYNDVDMYRRSPDYSDRFSGRNSSNLYFNGDHSTSSLVSDWSKDKVFSLEDITRMLREETHEGLKQSSYMSLLEVCYAKALAKRNVVRDLRRELQLSNLAGEGQRKSSDLACSYQQLLNDGYEDSNQTLDCPGKDPLEDITRMLREETHEGLNQSSYLSLLEVCYAKALANRNVVRDLRRELQLSNLAGEGQRKSSDLACSYQQLLNDGYEDSNQTLDGPGKDPLVVDVPQLNVFQNVDLGAPERNTCAAYRPRWNSQSSLGSEPGTPPFFPPAMQESSLNSRQSSCGDRKVPSARCLLAEFTSSVPPRLQSPRNLYSVRKEWSTMESPDKKLRELRYLQKQAFLKNGLLRKPHQFQLNAGNPSITCPIGAKQVGIPNFPETVLQQPNEQNIVRCQERNKLRESQYIQGIIKETPQNDAKVRHQSTLHDAKNDSSKDHIHSDRKIPLNSQGNNVNSPDKPNSSVNMAFTKTNPALDQKTTTLVEEINQKHTQTSRARDKLVCNYCFSTFPTEKAYKKHMADDHKETRPHICGFCGKGFHDKFDLKRHHRTHTGVRPYKCSICPRAFTQRCSLETHVNKVHDVELNFAFKERRKKIHVCEDCGNSVNDAFEHYLHKWIVHSRLAMPKRLKKKVLHRIKCILKAQHGESDKSSEDLLANAQIVTQSIYSLKEISES